ncbi:hypothetical protein GCM10010289_22600 [Streptomyces violascens]|nr:hypothetical protein GCM10010289_22600 [Streptomyces violascens]
MPPLPPVPGTTTPLCLADSKDPFTVNLDDYRATFFFYAPEKNPHGWNLDLEAFGEKLSAAYPEARAQTRGEGDELRLSFWAVTDDGTEYTGYASTNGRDTVLLSDNIAESAALLTQLLREETIPTPDLVHFSSEPAVLAGIETDWRIPAGADQEKIFDELQQHVRVVEGS